MYSYVCVLSTDNYLNGVLILNENLKQLKSKYDLLCIINENIKKETVEILDYFHIKHKKIKSIEYNNYTKEKKYWRYTFDKLNIYNLTEYKKIVYLDSDLLLLKNLDHLFRKPKNSMPPDLPFKKKSHNSGIMVIEPNSKDFKNMLKIVERKNEKGISDQDIINEYFNHINTLDKTYNVTRELENKKINIYNSITEKSEKGYPVAIYLKTKKEPKIIHYIGKTKPFMIRHPFDDEYCYQYLNLLNIVLKKRKEQEILSKNLLISIIIPVYNKKTKLKKCLDSIINQTYKNLEIILINDASTDNSLAICEEYKRNDPRIVLINKEKNKGVSAARNSGLKIAKGKYISFIDADDTIDKNMYKILIQEIETKQLEFIQFGSTVNKTKRNISTKNIHFSTNKQLIKQLITKNNITSVVWDKLYLRNLIKDIKFDENLKKHEDGDFVFEVLKRSKNAEIINDILYHYTFESKGSLTKDYSYEDNKAVLQHTKKVETYIDMKYPELKKDSYNFIFGKKIYFIFSLATRIFREKEMIKISDILTKEQQKELTQYMDDLKIYIQNNKDKVTKKKVRLATDMIEILEKLNI